MDAVAILFLVTTVLFGIIAAPAFMPRAMEFKVNLKRYRRMQLLAKGLGGPAIVMAVVGIIALAANYVR